MAVCKPWKRILAKTCLCHHLDLGLLASISVENFCCVNHPVYRILLWKSKLTETNISKKNFRAEHTYFGTDVLSEKTGLCLINCLLLGGRWAALGTSPAERISTWEALHLSGTAGSFITLQCVESRSKYHNTDYAGTETIPS